MLVGSIESCSASYFSEVSSSLLTSNEILLGPQVKLSTMPRLPATICMNGRILMLSDLQSFCEFASEPRLEEATSATHDAAADGAQCEGARSVEGHARRAMAHPG